MAATSPAKAAPLTPARSNIPLPPSRAARMAAKEAELDKQRTGLIRELYRKGPDDVWTPSFSVAFRLLILIRMCGAMYSSVTADCDEVYNYWEPLHFLLYGDGMRTWEYSAKYAIRSWAYVLLHTFPAKVVQMLRPIDKRASFFAIRLSLALLSTLCEVTFYRSIVKHIGARTARYTLLFLLFSAGMYNASTAFLPSSFSMYFVMLGWSFAMEPVTYVPARTRTAVLCFATSAVVGWPFSILLAIPFVLEELFLVGRDVRYSMISRMGRLVHCSLPALAILASVILTDSYFYGRIVIAPWNIISYNIFSQDAGPNIFGTEPWYYYLLNGSLNLNILMPMALLSLPAVAVTAVMEPKRMGMHQPGNSPNSVLLAIRLLPFYFWFGVLTMQPHKEERFMFPAFPLICFQAAVTLTLARGWMQHVYVKITDAPYNAARSSIFSSNTSLVVMLTTIISVARILALQHHFMAPMTALFHLQYTELPALAMHHYPQHYRKLSVANLTNAQEQIDLSPLESLNLTLCYGQEWYRYPSSFLLPSQVQLQFIQSDFTGQLPQHFSATPGHRREARGISALQAITSSSPLGFNNVNVQETSLDTKTSACSYIIDLEFPHRTTGETGRSASDDKSFEIVQCWPLLDSAHSSQATRSFYLPFADHRNRYGDFCLYRNASLQRH